MSTRYDGRQADELRPFSFTRDFTTMTMGSCLVTFGETRVLCTASVEDDVPRWMKGKGEGWVTAEYSMLPGSSPERIGRERRGAKGRTQEIERLIGRSLRAVTDMKALGETSIRLDCDVLQADGGTRTAAITGGMVALSQAVEWMSARGMSRGPVIASPVAAVSVGVVDTVPVLDLSYVEDVKAEVDMNVVMNGAGHFIEVQGAAEGAPFSRSELDAMLELAAGGIEELLSLQSAALETWRADRKGSR